MQDLPTHHAAEPPASQPAAPPPVPLPEMLRKVHSKDWNKEFQALLRQPDSLAKHRGLVHLAHDFVAAAVTYATIIVSEVRRAKSL